MDRAYIKEILRKIYFGRSNEETSPTNNLSDYHTENITEFETLLGGFIINNDNNSLDTYYEENL